MSLALSFDVHFILTLQIHLSSTRLFVWQYHLYSTQHHDLPSNRSQNSLHVFNHLSINRHRDLQSSRSPNYLHIFHRFTLYKLQTLTLSCSYILPNRRYHRCWFFSLYLTFHRSSSGLHECDLLHKCWCPFPTSCWSQLATLQYKCLRFSKQLCLSTPASRNTPNRLGHISRRPVWFVSTKKNYFIFALP